MLLTTAAAFQPDTVSPHDHVGLANVDWDMDVKLPNLIRGAARSARQLGDTVMHRDHLEDAIRAQRLASECDCFARRCEREANAIAVASGFLR